MSPLRLLAATALVLALLATGVAWARITATRSVGSNSFGVDKLENHLAAVSIASPASGSNLSSLTVSLGTVSAGQTVPLGFKLTNIGSTAQTVTVGSPTAQIASGTPSANPLAAGTTTASAATLTTSALPGVVSAASGVLRITGAGTGRNGQAYKWWRDRPLSLTNLPGAATSLQQTAGNSTNACNTLAAGLPTSSGTSSKCVKISWTASVSAAYLKTYELWRMTGTPTATAAGCSATGPTDSTGAAISSYGPLTTTPAMDGSATAFVDRSVSNNTTYSYVVCALSTDATGALRSTAASIQF